ncbi:ATP-binding protein [Deinococcus sedimenti]|uniref:ATP-binding protein n=1 Tax=Deinococcus sedimenti TaxID=1867090 RepID=UPI00166E6470|nr:AAA family ATPase [Deinococcus sedimenti]
MSVTLRLLGDPALLVRGARVPVRARRLLLLAALALEGRQSRARLSARLFPEHGPEEARARLRLELHRARGPLDGALHLDGEDVWLDAACDAAQLRGAVAAGDWAADWGAGRPWTSGELLSGVSVPDVPELDEWVEGWRAQVRAWQVGLLEAAVTGLDAQGRPEGALDAQRALLDAQPLSEAACDALTRLLWGAGRRAEAAQVQAAFTERFERELGWAPALGHALEGGSASPPPAAGSVSVLEPPLVGREGLWQQVLDWAGRAPAGGTLLLIGEGGVGKSRLLDALTRGPLGAGVGERRVLLRGSSGAAAGPFGALLRALELRPEVLGGLPRRVRDDLGVVAPQLCPPPLLPVGALSEARVQEAFTQALLALAGNGRVWVVEDAHWLDPSTLRVLARAQERSGARVLGAVRPEGLVPGGPLHAWAQELDGAGRLLRLEVPPLSELAVLKLIRLLSGSARATGFAQTLHGLSGGNPYALLSLVQGLLSRGVLSVDAQGAWQLHVDLPEVRSLVPGTLRAALEERVAAQGPAVLAALRGAALRGRSFRPEDAAAASGLDGAALDAALSAAAAHRWVEARPDGSFRLEHDLLREALRLGWPDPERAAGHARLARHLDGVGAAARERAAHWEAAGDSDRAAGLWREAASDARALWAHRETLLALDRALACTPGGPERAALHRERGRAFQALGDLDAWAAELDAAQGLVPDDRAEALRLALERTHLLLRRGEPQGALEVSAPWLAGPGLSGAEPADGRAAPEWGLLMHDRALALLRLGRADEAQALLRATLDAGGDDLLRANLHSTLAGVAYEQERPAEGLADARAAQALFRTLGRHEGEVVALTTLAELHRLLGDGAGQRSALEAALEPARRSGQYRMQHHVWQALSEWAQEHGEAGALRDFATGGLEAAEAEGHAAGAAVFQALLDQGRAQRS